MKKQIGATFRIIFLVAAVVLLIITAVIYFIDTPVVEEGKEPTLPQKIILTGKKYLSEILMAVGVSGIGAIAAFTKSIYKAGRETKLAAQNTYTDVAKLEKKLDERDQKIIALENKITTFEKKQDILSNMLFVTFSLSEMPSSLRKEIHSYQTAYNALQEAKTEIVQIVEEVKEAESVAEEKSEDKEKKETGYFPVYDENGNLIGYEEREIKKPSTPVLV